MLIVDEAGMLGTRQLHELCRHAATAGAKLVLVGDHAQLPEIDAGGTFRTLVERTQPIELTTNRRQQREVDRRLLDLWRAGELEQALTIATEAGDLVLDLTPEETLTRMVGDYCDALRRGDDAVMLAPRRAEVRHLNELARQLLIDKTQASDQLTIHDCEFAVGDLVVLRRNDRALDVQNGTRGRVMAMDAEAEALTLELLDGSQRVLPSRYLRAAPSGRVSPVDHGYAMTAHLAQGLTVDTAFVLGSETVHREWGYVAFSRARHRTRFYVVDPEISEEHHTAARPSPDRFSEALRRLDRSEIQQAGIDLLSAIAAKHNPVEYLESALGSRPHTFRGRRRWDKAARRIERFRASHGIHDRARPLGQRPDDRVQARAWDRAHREIVKSRLGLGLGRGEARSQGRDLV